LRYGMVIDLSRCVGCDACTLACKQKNGTTSGVYWCQVLKSEVGRYPNARPSYTPLHCMHCANPACVGVCPTGASVKRADGIVLVDQEKCIGCRACMIACPYDARFFLKKYEGYYRDKGLTAYEIAHRAGKVEGTISKCDLCLDLVEAGDMPACVQACPSRALFFGDLDDAESQIAKLIVARGGYQLHPEIGTDPSVYYLPG
jgi:molybdopterin-containing oxidoreductase family iron-sulfur binding subunit